MVGDDRGGLLHDRFPVRVGDACDEHSAGREPVEVDGRVQGDDRATADGLTDRDALDQGLSRRGGQPAAAQGGGAASGLHGLGPGLHDPQVSGESVLGPFQVHRAAVVLLDGLGPVGQEPNFRIGQHTPRTLLAGRVDGPGQPTFCVDGLLAFRADPCADHRVQRRVLHARLEHRVLVGIDLTADDGLPQPPGRAHDDDLGKAALRVEGEHHARTCQVGPDHHLDADGERDREMVEAHPLPVVDRTVGEERCVAAVAGLQQLGGPPDVQVGLLLPREARLRKVLGRGATAYGDLRFLPPLVTGELLVRRDDLGAQRLR